jgi:hypothetical protein
MMQATARLTHSPTTIPFSAIDSEALKQEHLSAAAADLFCVRIAAGSDDARTIVQKEVIRLILANHQRRLIVKRAVGMMNDGASRQRLAKSFLSAKSVDFLQFSGDA